MRSYVLINPRKAKKVGVIGETNVLCTMHESRDLINETTPETQVHWQRALLYLETTLFK